MVSPWNDEVALADPLRRSFVGLKKVALRDPRRAVRRRVASCLVWFRSLAPVREKPTPGDSLDPQRPPDHSEQR